MTFVVVLDTQIKKIKLRCSTSIIESDAQKPMVESGFGRRFHDLNYFEDGLFLFIFLEFVIYLRHQHKTLWKTMSSM